MPMQTPPLEQLGASLLPYPVARWLEDEYNYKADTLFAFAVTIIGLLGDFLWDYVNGVEITTIAWQCAINLIWIMIGLSALSYYYKRRARLVKQALFIREMSSENSQ